MYLYKRGQRLMIIHYWDRGQRITVTMVAVHMRRKGMEA